MLGLPYFENLACHKDHSATFSIWLYCFGIAKTESSIHNCEMNLTFFAVCQTRFRHRHYTKRCIANTISRPILLFQNTFLKLKHTDLYTVPNATLLMRHIDRKANLQLVSTLARATCCLAERHTFCLRLGILTFRSLKRFKPLLFITVAETVIHVINNSVWYY